MNDKVEYEKAKEMIKTLPWFKDYKACQVEECDPILGFLPTSKERFEYLEDSNDFCSGFSYHVRDMHSDAESVEVLVWIMSPW